jgi:hypothetical protein
MESSGKKLPQPTMRTYSSIYLGGQITKGNETLFPNWQKESWQTFEETSRYTRPEQVNKWPNSMTDV